MDRFGDGFDRLHLPDPPAIRVVVAGDRSAESRASGGFFICSAEAARLMPWTTAFCAGTENFS